MYAKYGRVPVYTFLIVLTIFGSWFSTAVAQQRLSLTLAEAEDLALANEPGHAALAARAEAAKEQAVAAGQLPDPVLRLGLSNYPIEDGGFTTEGMTQAQMGIRQAFPRARAEGAAGMEARSKAFDYQAAARHRDVLADVRRAWLQVYYAEQAWALVNESRPFFADLVTITTSLYAVGRKSQHDVLRAELELSRLDDRLIETERTRSEARAELSRWLGQDAYRPLAMKLPNWDSLPAEGDMQSGLLQHPAILAAESGVAAGQSAVRVAEERKKPGWALDLGYGHRGGYLPDGEPRSDFVSLSVSVDLPFFSKNRQDRKLAAALSERRAAIDTQNELSLRLGSELQTRYVRWVDLTRRLNLYEASILGQSEGQAQAALLAYQSDAGDFSDVMRSHIDKLNTRIQHIRLQVDRASTYAALASLGGFSQ